MNSFENLPQDFLDKWQGIANLLAKLINVPAALIMKTENEFMEVFLSSKSENNPYKKGDKDHWTGLYCETVIKTQRELLIPNALKDNDWDKNPDIKLGMIAYLGLPLNFPDKTPFGTICVLDKKENSFSDEQELLLKQFKNVIELDLAIIQSLNIKESDNIIAELLKQYQELKTINIEYEAVNEELSQANEELIEAKQLAEESELRLVEAQTVAKVGNWETDLLTMEVFWSNETYKIFELDSNTFEPTHHSFLEFVHPDDRKKVDNAFSNSINTDKSNKIVHRVVTSKGIIKYVEEHWRIVRNSKGEPIKTFGTCQDITEQIQVQQALNESEEKFRSIFEKGLSAILVADDKGNYVALNPAAANLFGYSVKELLNMNIANLNTAIEPGAAERYKKYIESGEETGEFDFINKKGQKKIAIYRAVHIKPDFNLSMLFDITDRKKAEQELIKAKKEIQESEYLHRQILSNISDAVFLTDANDKFTYICPNVHFIFGYKKEEVEKMHKITELIPALGNFDKQLLQAQGEVHNFECSIRNKLNEQRDLIITAKKLNIRNPEILYSCRDITDRKKTEQALKESEDKYKAIFEQAGVGVALLKTQTGEYLEINNTYCNFLGYAEQEMLQKTFKDVTFADDTGVNLEANSKLINRELQKFSYDKRYVRKDGTIVWGRLTVSPLWKSNEETEEYLHIAIVEDISEEKKAESALKESEEKYKALHQSMNEGVCLHEMIYNDRGEPIDYKIIDANPKYQEITGLKIEYVINKLGSKIYQDEAPPYLDDFARVAMTEKPFNFITFFKPFDKYFHISVFSPKKGQFATVFQDITEEKKAEQKIQKYTQELEEANATKNKFFNIIAHDLKNPFTTIIGFSNLLKNNIHKYDKERIYQFVENINNSGQSTFKLLENLLEWSRAQTGKITFNPEKLILEDIVIDIIQQSSDITKAKRIAIDYTIPSPITIFADQNMLRVILRNLTTNAIKFTNQGGKITINATQNDNETVIKISDNGIGMNAEILNNLFKIDEKVSRTGTANETGTGLGLLLCKEFVESHAGEIRAESIEGKGSTFFFTIPKKP